MVSSTVAVAPDRLDLIACAPRLAPSCSTACGASVARGPGPRWRTTGARAEAELVRWLRTTPSCGSP